jgi:hypothetical protein
MADREATERWLRDHPELPDPIGVSAGVAVARQGFLFDQETTTLAANTGGAGETND